MSVALLMSGVTPPRTPRGRRGASGGEPPRSRSAGETANAGKRAESKARLSRPGDIGLARRLGVLAHTESPHKETPVLSGLFDGPPQAEDKP